MASDQVWQEPAGEKSVYEPSPAGEVAIAVPGLVLLDTSRSMTAEMNYLNSSFEELREGLRRNPDISPIAYMGIAAFDDTARLFLDFVRLADPSLMVPPFRSGGNKTNYQAAFQCALDMLRAGLRALKTPTKEGAKQVYRPTIYMITDGQPNTGGNWQTVLDELKTRSWAPNRMVFGIRDADRDVCRSIASPKMAYFADDGHTPQTVMSSILAMILRSMVLASRTAQSMDSPTVPLPSIDPKDDPTTQILTRLDVVEDVD